ncbi:MAG: GtrA family protein [Minisyncoccia bacterium]
MKDNIKKIFLYGIGGGIAFLITFFLTYFLTEKLNLYYLISAIIGYLSGLLFNFNFQAFITFETKKEFYLKRLFKFILTQLFGLIFYSITVYFLTDILKFYYLFSLIISSGFTYILNFLLAKFFVFEK